MNAGKLRHPVEVQKRHETRGSDGGVSETWTPVRSVRARIVPLSAREQIEADSIEGRRSHRIEMRYFEGLTSGHRIKFGDRVFNIDGVLNVDERNRETHALCVELT